MALETTAWNIQDYLRSPEECALFIEAALIANDVMSPVFAYGEAFLFLLYIDRNT